MTTEITKPELTDTSSLRRSDVAKEIAISAVKSVVGVVPWIGQALNEALFDCRGRIKQERLNAFFSDVAVRVEQLGEEKIDKQYITTDEFSDFIEQIAKRVADNRNQKKRSIYSSLLIAGVCGHRPPELSSTFLGILEEISDSEFELFSTLFKLSHKIGPVPPRFEGDFEDGQFLRFPAERIATLGISKSDFLAMVQSMIRQGILFDDSAGRFNTQPFEVLRISELGVRFYGYITSE